MPRRRRAAVPPPSERQPVAPERDLGLFGLPARYVAGLSREQRAQVAKAQASWWRRQANLDPRLARYSRPLTIDELESGLRVLAALFCPSDDVSLWAALRWGETLRDAVGEAREAGHEAPLPLPYAWLTRGELDAIETADVTATAHMTGMSEEADDGRQVRRRRAAAPRDTRGQAAQGQATTRQDRAQALPVVRQRGRAAAADAEGTHVQAPRGRRAAAVAR